MTAISTDGTHGVIYGLQVEEFPGSTHGTSVTGTPKRLAIIHGDVDTQAKADTIDLDTYINGTVHEIRGISYESAAGTDSSGSATFSGTTITFTGHADADVTATAKYKFGALVEMT